MRWLSRIGLSTPAHRAWALYDWANSAFTTSIISALFPPFFVQFIAGNGCARRGLMSDLAQATWNPWMSGICAEAPSLPNATMWLGFANAAALFLCAFLSPAIGAYVDHHPRKKRWLGMMTLLGSTLAALLYFAGSGDWLYALLIFGFGQIALNIAFVIYDGLLPHIAGPGELDRVSTAGYAIGYVGGGTLLALHAAMLTQPAWFGFASAGEAIPWAFVSVGVWWAVFSLPLLLRVPEPPTSPPKERVVWWKQVVTSARKLHRYPHAFALLIAFLIYNDGIGTMQRMSTAYGQEIGLAAGDMIVALLVVQFVGIPATFGFGRLAGRFGTKASIMAGLVVYGGVTFAAYFITTATHFFFLALFIGLVQGGTQSLSRAAFASMIPPEESSEYFGVFAVFERFAGIFGPLTMAIAIAVFGGSRPAILSIGIFFVIGLGLLARVDFAAGRADVAGRSRA